MEGRISIRQVLDDLTAHPLLRGLTLERAVNHAVHFIRLVGMPEAFAERTAVVPIVEHRGVLPCDFYDMTQVREIRADGRPGRAYRYAGDSFHTSPREKGLGELTYKIQGNNIFTSVPKGQVEIAYKCILVDEDGYPLIPDDSPFIRALELYIKKAWFTGLFDMGKITSTVLQNTQQEYAWAVGQAQTSLIRLTPDKMQSVANMLGALLPRDGGHDNAFKRTGDKERLKF